MDVTAGADSSGSVDDVGAADDLASPQETENYSGDQDTEQERSESAPAAVKQQNPPTNEYVEIKGFGRVHKDDAPKFREFIKGAYGAFEQANLSQRDWKELERDPEAFLEKKGIDLDSIAGRRLAAKLEAQLQTPEQQQQSKAERDYHERETKLKEREDALAKKELDELTTREVQQIDKDWSDALEAVGLPKHRGTLREMASVARDYLAKGIDVPAAHLAEIVRDQRVANEQWHQKQTFEETSDEAFAKYMSGLSEKTQERIRSFFLNQIKSPTSRPQPSQPRQQPQRSQGPRSPSEMTGKRKIMTEAEYRQWMNE